MSGPYWTAISAGFWKNVHVSASKYCSLLDIDNILILILILIMILILIVNDIATILIWKHLCYDPDNQTTSPRTWGPPLTWPALRTRWTSSPWPQAGPLALGASPRGPSWSRSVSAANCRYTGMFETGPSTCRSRTVSALAWSSLPGKQEVSPLCLKPPLPIAFVVSQ